MRELKLPHIAPIRFAQEILRDTQESKRVSLVFEEIPSLGMMVEAAAQSSAAYGNEDAQSGFLVSLKNVKRLQNPTKKELEVSLVNESNLGTMSSFSFEVFEAEVLCVSGNFIVAKN